MKKNGFKNFGFHTYDKNVSKITKALAKERGEFSAFALTEDGGGLSTIDPETAARQHLQLMLESTSLPEMEATELNQNKCEFRSLGTETIPLTGTKTVKFRQTYDKIPVYGSLVTIEMDESNEIMAVNSSLGTPKDIDGIAKISPMQAIEAAGKDAGHDKEMLNITPRLVYYFDLTADKWHLAYMIEDVPSASGGEEQQFQNAHLMDYFVDAHNGKIIAKRPRTPNVAQSVVEPSIDGLGKSRDIRCMKENGQLRLHDDLLNVHTYDFGFKDLVTNVLPGNYMTNPPQPWNDRAVSAHANAALVAEFLRSTLKRNGIDNLGSPLVSSVNCIVKKQSPDGQQWNNAAWFNGQMVYGQKKVDGNFRSYAVGTDVVAHEIFHGITDKTARLEYAAESGALNESYSDIFGVIISNFDEKDMSKWNWQMGEDLNLKGIPLRDFQDPTKFEQPAHMDGYENLPITEKGDWGGVHINSGIHNFAAYKIMTAKNPQKNYLFDANSLAALFYLALTQFLTRTSVFSESRRAVETVAQTLFRNDAPNVKKRKLEAISAAYVAVGIEID